MGLGALQPMHLIVILVIVLLVFGPGKLPELGRAVGDGLRELKKATTGEDKDKTEALAAATTTSTVTPISVAPTAPTMASRPCPSCRGAVPVGDKFCGNCGTTMDAVSRSA
jgi:sec-independent protein translocase protein TatA